ncbi:MAG: copper amine oxidase N-terminal domain-containing protein [Peptococcaceae bacterium]|nr:copper amine oxidase N-terminal domain-containing protein [Peptococcaceae bacterium]
MKKFDRKKIRLGAGILLLSLSLFGLPVLAGEVLLTKGGLDNLLQRYLLPKEQQIESLNSRAQTLEASLQNLESLTVSRLLLWPEKTTAQLYAPGSENAETRSLDVPPQIIDGRTMVPLRFIGDVLGASVEWNGQTRQISYVTKDRSILLTLDKTAAVLNGTAAEMDVAPASIGGRTMVPVRFVSQWLGAAVSWDGATRTVEVKYYNHALEGDQ